MLYILIADTKTARLFGFDSARGSLEEIASFHNSAGGQHERDLVADRPGRTIAGVGRIRHAYEPRTSEKQQSLRRWLKSTGEELDGMLAQRELDGLVLVAAPRLLVQLRVCLPKSLRGFVRAELPLDLAKQPILQITRRLKVALRALSRRMSVVMPPLVSRSDIAAYP